MEFLKHFIVHTEKYRTQSGEMYLFNYVFSLLCNSVLSLIVAYLNLV